MSAHGCYNKPRQFDGKYTAQAGWSATYQDRGAPVRVPVFVEVQSSFKPGCKYDKAASDARCVGCDNLVGAAIQEPLYEDGCVKCGIVGIHACTGTPILEWTEEEKRKLFSVLKKYSKEPK